MPRCGPRTCRASNWVKLWLIAGDARLLESLRGSGCLPGILKLGPVHTLGRPPVNVSNQQREVVADLMIDTVEAYAPGFQRECNRETTPLTKCYCGTPTKKISQEAAYSRRRVHIMAMPRNSGSDTWRSRAGGAEILYCGDYGGAGERAPLWRS